MMIPSPGEGLPPDEPVGQLPPQDWMAAAETQAVIAALTAEGAEVRFVGGCVRDSLLRRPIRDIDIATHDNPDRVIALLHKAGLKAIPTGLAHGTVTGVAGRAHFEITTLRRDIETFGRHARVSYTSDWSEDAARRDFTINAMFCRPDGIIFDPFGGLADLGAGRVRFVGDAMRRIDEDVLRLLRFFRFYAHYGRPPADAAALEACRLQAAKLPQLSGERVHGEVMKLLLAPEPAAVILLMQSLRVLQQILPEAQDVGRLRVLAFLENRGIVHPRIVADPLRRLAALLRCDRAGAQAVGRRLRLSRADTDRLAGLAEPPAWPAPQMDIPTARRLLHRVGSERFCDLLLLAWAARKAVTGRTPPGETNGWVALLDLADRWQPVSLPVQGKDLIALGISRGPRIGALLGQIERWWEEGDYQAGRAETLEKLKALAVPHLPLGAMSHRR